ncbi:MAG TPA: hypothetical protein VIG96_08650 [Blastococcus sp.]
MRIVGLETVRTPRHPNLLFLRLRTDDGLVGLGEAFSGALAVEAYLHETAADVLFALPDVSPELCARTLTPYLGFHGAGAEIRGNGAIDLAVWRLLGKAAGLPLTRLLGGPVRTRCPSTTPAPARVTSGTPPASPRTTGGWPPNSCR